MGEQAHYSLQVATEFEGALLNFGSRRGWQDESCNQLNVTVQWLSPFIPARQVWLRMALQRYIPAEYLPFFWPLLLTSVVLIQSLSLCASALLL